MKAAGAVLMKQENVNGELVLSYLSRRNPAPTWQETLRGERYWVPELNGNVQVFEDKAAAAECQVLFGGEPVNTEVAMRLDILEKQKWTELTTIRETYPGMGL